MSIEVSWQISIFALIIEEGMLEEPYRLSEEFQDTLDLLEESDHSIFLTGKAGTGKSTLLQLFRRTTRKKQLCWLQLV